MMVCVVDEFKVTISIGIKREHIVSFPHQSLLGFHSTLTPHLHMFGICKISPLRLHPAWCRLIVFRWLLPQNPYFVISRKIHVHNKLFNISQVQILLFPYKSGPKKKYIYIYHIRWVKSFRLSWMSPSTFFLVFLFKEFPSTGCCRTTRWFVQNFLPRTLRSSRVVAESHSVSLPARLPRWRCQMPELNKQTETSLDVVRKRLPSWCFTQLGQWAEGCWSQWEQSVRCARTPQALTSLQAAADKTAARSCILFTSLLIQGAAAPLLLSGAEICFWSLT